MNNGWLPPIRYVYYTKCYNVSFQKLKRTKSLWYDFLKTFDIHKIYYGHVGIYYYSSLTLCADLLLKYEN